MTGGILKIDVEEVLPTAEAVLEGQGIPRGTVPDERTSLLVRDAISRFAEKARPAGLLAEITPEAFRAVLEGEGRNDPDSPVEPISRSAGSLALFAVTVGEEIGGEIHRLFQGHDFALGSLLDSAASEGVERAARALEEAYRRRLREAGRLPPGHGTLRFSPGYCGWDLSAQRALFESLRPGRIGIALNESFLMRPLKSISGVIIAGRKEIFEFDDAFSFCSECATHECRDRIAGLRQQ